MDDVVNNILINSDLISGVSFKKNPNSNELLLELSDGSGSMIFYTLFPGMTLAYIHIDSPLWPESDANTTIKPLRINYCVSGRGELLLDDNTYIYLKEKDFCISQQAAQDKYIFPTKHYLGLSIYFDLDMLCSSGKVILDSFGIDLYEIIQLYCSKKKTYISESNEQIESILNKLWNLYENPSLFYMKLHVLELLHLLSMKTNVSNKTCAYYTSIQVELAKKAEHILTKDLRRHFPIREIAEKFSISESSLKQYFRGVFGDNISSYLRTMRMNTAAKMLTETKKNISEISLQVGYTNQGKFAAVFKQYFNMTPLEYRRTKHLEQFYES